MCANSTGLATGRGELRGQVENSPAGRAAAGPTATKAKSQAALPGSQSEYGQGGKARSGGERSKSRKRTKQSRAPEAGASPSLLSHSYTTAEARSTRRCRVASYFVLCTLRGIRPKRQSVFNSLAQCPPKSYPPL